MKTCLQCNTVNLREAKFCHQCGASLRGRLPESEESVIDAEYRRVPPARHWNDKIWTKDTFLGQKKWLRSYTWPQRIGITVIELLLLVAVVVAVNTYVIR